jgi:hypothetical protein
LLPPIQQLQLHQLIQQHQPIQQRYLERQCSILMKDVGIFTRVMPVKRVDSPMKFRQ